MGGPEIIDITAPAHSTAAKRYAEAYRSRRIEAASEITSYGTPVTDLDQLEAMTKLVLLADEMCIAVLGEQ